MLVLGVNDHSVIHLSNGVRLTYFVGDDGKPKIGIDAPASVLILREELMTTEQRFDFAKVRDA